MNISQILRNHQLRVTPHRCSILNHFIQSNRAYTPSDLESVFSDKMDRVSIYRILNSLCEANLLCKLVDSNGMISYVYDKHSGSEECQNHPHFKCKSCHSVIELPELPKTYMEFLDQLNIDDLNFLAEGRCKQCEQATE